MKIVTILYDGISNRYGINESHKEEFNKGTYIIQNGTDQGSLEGKIEEILKEKGLIKRRIGVKLSKLHLAKYEKEYEKLMDLVYIIQKLNPNAIIIK